MWSVLTPFRNPQLTLAFTSVLVHHLIYHTSVGMYCTLLYASPLLLRQLAGDADVAALVRAGRLVVVQWDRFGSYQELDEEQVGLRRGVVGEHGSGSGGGTTGHVGGEGRAGPGGGAAQALSPPLPAGVLHGSGATS